MSTALTTGPVMGFLSSKQAAILGAVPRTLKAQLTWTYVIQGVALAISNNPKLAECNPHSVYTSVLHIIRLGLDPSGMTQQAYLVPFWDNRKNSQVCTPMIGQQGKIELAYRSGKITKIITQVVHEFDNFTHNLGDGSLSHSINLREPQRGKAIAAYCRIWLVSNPDPLLEIMTLADFERIKATANKRNKGKLSPAYKAWPEEMWRRSVLGRALKRAPKSADLLDALTEEATFQKKRDRGDIIDVEFDVSKAPEAIDTGGDALGIDDDDNDAWPDDERGEPERRQERPADTGTDTDTAQQSKPTTKTKNTTTTAAVDDDDDFGI